MAGHSQFSLLTQRRFLPYFTVQALGAFNDNVYRQAIIGLLFFLGVSSAERTLYTNLAPAIFILPYFLFSGIAGQIAERMEKQRLIRITTLMEIAIMSVAAVGFLASNMILLLVALFFTGVQAALFGPVKYSILPSVLRPEELTGGNGLVEMGTSISILCGMIYGGLIYQVPRRRRSWATWPRAGSRWSMPATRRSRSTGTRSPRTSGSGSSPGAPRRCATRCWACRGSGSSAP